MSFLAPLYLLLGAAAAVPLLLHLLRRRIGTTVEFPAARYLAQAEQEHSAKLRLQNWLLMALRVLAVLLVALAAARPLGRLAAGGHPPMALAVVLDNSLSTTAVVDGRPLFEQLRSAADAVLRDASPADRVWLVTADLRVVGGARDAVRDALARAEPFTASGDLRAATDRAAELARGARLPNVTVVVITDGQATAWRSAADVASTPTVIFAPGADATPAPNRAVIAAGARPARWTPAGAVFARVASDDSVAYRVALTGATTGEAARTVARGTAEPRAEIIARVQPGERGWVAGTVAVAPDELRGDDVRHFAVFVGDPPAVRVDESAGPFVTSAVATLAASRRLTVGAGTGAGTTATIAEASAGARLPALFVAPNDPTALGAANQALARAGVPWRFGAARGGEMVVRFRGDSAGVSEGAEAAAPITAARRYALVSRGSARVDTLATAGTDPWIVAGDGYVLIASPLVPDATTFPVRASFVTWLADVVAQRLGGAVGTVASVTPGARITPPADANALLSPDGRRSAVTAQPLSTPAQPGVYFWLRDGARVGAVEVNPEAEESRLERLSGRALRDRVRGAQVTAVDRVEALTAAAWRGEGRRPVGGPLLGAALLALVAEGFATRRAGRAARR